MSRKIRKNIFIPLRFYVNVVNFGVSRSSQTTIFAVLEAQNFQFHKFAILVERNLLNFKVRGSKTAKNDTL